MLRFIANKGNGMPTLSQSLIPCASRWFLRPYAIGLLSLLSGAALLCGRAAFAADINWIGGGANEWNSPAGGHGLYVLNSGLLTVNGDGGIAGDIGRYTVATGTHAVGEMDIHGGTLNVNNNDFRLGTPGSAANVDTRGLISQDGGSAN